MNEQSVMSAFRKKLIEREFYVKKINDKSTLGVPDTFIAKEHKGMFLEGKFFERAAIPVQFKAFSAIKLGPQLTTMCDMDRSFVARYVLFFKVPGSKILCARVQPSLMLRSIQNQEAIGLLLYNMDEFITNLERFLQLPESNTGEKIHGVI